MPFPFRDPKAERMPVVLRDDAPRGPNAAPPDWTEFSGQRIRSPQDAVQLVLGPNTPNRVDVAFVDSHHRVVSLEPHRLEALETTGERQPQRSRARSAATAVLVARLGGQYDLTRRAVNRRLPAR